MFRNFYLVKSYKIFSKTQKFSRKLTILTSKLKLSELSSTLQLQSDVKKKPDIEVLCRRSAALADPDIDSGRTHIAALS